MRPRTRSSQTSPLIQMRAHQMRYALTPTEEKLWEQIRGGRLGVWFRRQVPVGKYIADFVAPSQRLIVEVDGGYHVGRRRADERRDRKLARLGYRVLRLDAELVRTNIGEAVAQVRAALASP
jgi:very-short-patch-repair endonuclease